MSARKLRGQKNVPVRHTPKKSDTVAPPLDQNNDLLDWEQITLEAEVNQSNGLLVNTVESEQATHASPIVSNSHQMDANVRQVDANTHNVHQMGATTNVNTMHQMGATAMHQINANMNNAHQVGAHVNDTHQASANVTATHQAGANMMNVAALTSAMHDMAACITRDLEAKLQSMINTHIAQMNMVVHTDVVQEGSAPSTGVPMSSNDVNTQDVMQPNMLMPATYARYDYGKLVDLPKFSGDPLEWPMFERSYSDTTNEFRYNNTQNLIRIRKALVGDARAAVESMLPFPESVSEIMTVLKETFGRPEQLMNRHVGDMRKLQKIQFGNCYALSKFSNVLKNMTAFAKYAQTEYRLCDATLLAECVGKLPYELQLQWAVYKESVHGYADLQHFSAFVQSAAKRANVVQDAQPRTYEYGRQNVTSSNKANVRGHAFTANKRDNNCVICNKSAHAVADCDAFKKMSVDARWDRVKSTRLCFACLKYGHGANSCYSKNVCGVGGCKRKHHNLLHQSEVQQSTETEVVFNAEALSSNANILFQIIPVEITAANNTIKTYAFIDQGASHTMVEHSLVQRLGISGQKDVLEMHWLNNVQVKYPCERVTLGIRGFPKECKEMKLTNVYTVRDMNLPKQSVKFDGEIGQGAYKKMVSVHYENAVPEIIIGLDNVNMTVPLERPCVGDSQR